MEGYFIEAKYGWVCVHFNNENKYTQKTIDKSFFFFFKHNAKIPKKKTVQRLWTKAYNTLVHFKTDTI